MHEGPIVRGLYSVERGDSTFGVVKVLALDPHIVHARLYRNKLESRPKSIDPALLSLGSVFTGEDIGIGHTPLALESFLAWKPVLLQETEVTDDELVGYQYWLESMKDEILPAPEQTPGIIWKIISILRRKRRN